MEPFLFINSWKGGLAQFLCRTLFRTISQLAGVATFDILHALQPATNMHTEYNDTTATTTALHAIEFAAGTLIVLVVHILDGNILDVIFQGQLLYTAMCLIIQGVHQRRWPCDPLDAVALCGLFFLYHAQSVADGVHRWCLEFDRYIQVNVLDAAASVVGSYAQAFLERVRACYHCCLEDAKSIGVTPLLLSTVSFFQDYTRFVVDDLHQWYHTPGDFCCDPDQDELQMQDGLNWVEIIIQEPGEAVVTIRILVHDEDVEIVFRNENLELRTIAPTLSAVAGGVSRSGSLTISMTSSKRPAPTKTASSVTRMRPQITTMGTLSTATLTAVWPIPRPTTMIMTMAIPPVQDTKTWPRDMD